MEPRSAGFSPLQRPQFRDAENVRPVLRLDVEAACTPRASPARDWKVSQPADRNVSVT